MPGPADSPVIPPEAQFARAVQLYNNKSYVEAKEVFEELRLGGHERSQSAYFLGLIAMSTGNNSLAMKQFEEAIAADPRGTADAHFYMGELFLKAEQIDLAKKHYLEARSLQPFNEPAKSRLSEIDRYTRDPTPYRGDIYDMLRESADPFAQAAVRLIDETRVIEQPLNLRAFTKERVRWWIVIGVLLLVGSIYSVLGVHFLQQSSGMSRNAQYIASQDYSSQPQWKKAIDEEWSFYRHDHELGGNMLGIGLITLLPAIFLFVGYRIYIRKIGKTRITIDRGLIVVESGLFSSSRTIHEIYRIAEFQTEQNFFNMRTGDGALVLIQDGRRKAVIPGLMKYDELKQLAMKLRSLHLDLRSTSINKGIMA